jgi:hypothetical protein
MKMAKSERYFSIDVEASGPIPGLWWMPSFGSCPTDDLKDGFKALLKPLDKCYAEIDAIREEDVPGAMKVVAQGTEGFTWNATETDKQNCLDLYNHYDEVGEDLIQAFSRFKTWLHKRSRKLSYRAYMVGAPLSFDFMWIYWYYQFVMQEMPEFGFSGLDMRSYFMGAHGEKGLRSNKRRYKRHYPTNIPHTHDPLDDAREQGDIWQQMVEARQSKELVDKVKDFS